MNWRNVLSLTKSTLLTKKLIAFYLLLLLFQLPFFIDYNYALSMLLISSIIGGQVLGGMGALDLIGFILSIFIFLVPLFFILSYIVIGGLMNYTQDRSLGKSLKTGLFNSRRVIPALLLVIILQFLITGIIDIYREGSLLELPSDEFNYDMDDYSSISTDLYSPYLFRFFDTISKYGKPIMIIPEGIADLCLINMCSEAISTFVFSISFIQAVFYVLISLFSLFIVQEIILSKSGIIGSIRNSFSLVKNNFRNVSILWILSIGIYMIVYLLSLLVSLLLPLLTYPLLTFGLVLIILLQTTFYIQIKNPSKEMKK